MLFGKKKKGAAAVEYTDAKSVLQTDILKYTPSGNDIVSASVSFIGGRKSQQDVLDYRTLSGGQFAAVVCDGMGGLNGGAQAAREACDGFFSEYEKALSLGFKIPEFPQIAQRLDRRLLRLQDENGLPLDGGSTLTAVVAEQEVFHWLAVGDSRIGLLRNGTLRWLNRLHNYRMELDEALKNGDISPFEFQAELPRSAALLSYLGCGDLKYIDYQIRQPFMPSDILLLCSDGFLQLLPEASLVSTLYALDETLTNLPDLLAARLEQSGQSMDNASAVIIRRVPEKQTDTINSGGNLI